MLSQPTAVSGLDLLDHTQVTWLADCATEGKLETYEVTTTTVSDQIAAHGLAVVDMLKIDVEGYFLEVLKGIRPEDIGKVRNIAMECDFLPEIGVTRLRSRTCCRRWATARIAWTARWTTISYSTACAF